MLGVILNLVLGGVAGWLAGKIMKSEGGLIRNVILGVLGGVVGSLLLGIIGISGSGIIGGLIVSVLGACLLIWVVDKFFKK
ncbi:MAG: GlsB/YeaQ/YmgE family stress response membrane protein [Lachnospiraceae bacterium]